MRLLCELSGENLPLADAEFDALLSTRGHRIQAEDGTPLPYIRVGEVRHSELARELGRRMGLLRQLLLRASFPLEAAIDPISGREPTACFRWLGPPPVDVEERLRRLVEQHRSGGGRVQLARADREFRVWLEGERLAVAERIAVVDREGFAARRMPQLPFQRPVSLPPKRARALANLGRVEPGMVVVDPFVGTGALLLEAALLGARVVGVDRSPEMVRGAARNFSHLGQSAEELLAEDAGTAARRFAPRSIGALVTDPPYGRAAGTGGEAPEPLLERVLSAWESRLAPNARIAIAVPRERADPIGAPWERRSAIPDYVHRSLVREFRVYARAGALP
ncbi:MAG: methyltransferase domain-containing protein [Thermoplasmata archaeon]|nr:methyltransferase domain-containing protein [Thermoplasmata archaeon]